MTTTSGIGSLLPQFLVAMRQEIGATDGNDASRKLRELFLRRGVKLPTAVGSAVVGTRPFVATFDQAVARATAKALPGGLQEHLTPFFRAPDQETRVATLVKEVLAGKPSNAEKIAMSAIVYRRDRPQVADNALLALGAAADRIKQLLDLSPNPPSDAVKASAAELNRIVSETAVILSARVKAR